MNEQRPGDDLWFSFSGESKASHQIPTVHSMCATLVVVAVVVVVVVVVVPVAVPQECWSGACMFVRLWRGKCMGVAQGMAARRQTGRGRRRTACRRPSFPAILRPRGKSTTLTSIGCSSTRSLRSALQQASSSTVLT